MIGGLLCDNTLKGSGGQNARSLFAKCCNFFLSAALLAGQFDCLDLSFVLNLGCGRHVCFNFCPYIPHFICFLDYVQHVLGFGFRGINLTANFC